MLKVVLVDDEPSVLEGLRIFVDWEKTGFKIVGEASDGLAAFPIIQDTKPELVICDIRMPGLTGLELMEKVNACTNSAPKFIFLSGYTDFSYAQKALQLGSLGYLTKPLDAEELASELSRAAGIIENERKSDQENLELIRYAANQLFNDILGGKRNEKLTRKAHFLFNIPEDANMRILQFITDGSETLNAPEDGIYGLLMQITGIQNENCIFYNGSGSYIVMMHDGVQELTYCSKLAEQLAWQLNHTDPGNYGFKAFWALISGVSGCEILESIHKCGKQLEQLQTYCMLHPEYKVVCYETLGTSPILPGQSITGLGTVFPELPFDKLINTLKGNSTHAVQIALDELFIELDQNVYSSRLCTIFLYRLADVVRKMAYAYGIEASRVILNFTDSVGNRNPNCKKLALVMCNTIFEKLNENNVKPLALLENEVIDHIRANYRKSLSLQNIAEIFSMPAIITSKIIKKKTGQKFTDYVNHLRIEHAKTLIASSNMKVTAVCEESGYSDYNYFTEKFKELTGISPSEYKKKFS
jgi:two-component system response regulator YesN